MEDKGRKQKQSFYKKLVAAAAGCIVLAGVCVVGAGMFGGKDRDEKASTPAKTEKTTGETTASAEKDDVEVTAIASAKDYDEIHSYIEAENKKQRQYAAGGTAEMKVESSMDSEAGTSSYGDTQSGYSDTNTREEGIGEGDIVKTDGEKLYILNNRWINIVDITGEKLKELGKIDLGSDIYVSEIFVKNDRLVAVYTWSEYTETSGKDSYGSYREYSVAETFDVSQPAKPRSIGKITQSGSFRTMRAAGDYIYMLSNYYPDMGGTAKDVEAYVPTVQGKVMESADIFLPSWKAGSQYTVITSFSLDDPNQRADSKAVFGTMGMCYVSGENIYICESDYSEGMSGNGTTRTWIRKIGYEDGEFKAVGQVKVKGTLNDSFSIDEYQGNLRLVTTADTVGNSGIMPLYSSEGAMIESDGEPVEENQDRSENILYILDQDLKELSRIEGLAEDEQVYSARFMGDSGYFVTYRQIDPLFSVDLSDPENPRILGELKIPGFSQYLHPYGEGLLLGIGMDVDETGTTTNGVKLSMFDISDPKDVKEIQKYVLEGAYSTDVAYNYKAALADTEKNLIGFTAYGNDQKYEIFSYEKESGFRIVFERELMGMSSNVRGLYAGDTFYLAAGNTVEAYRLESFEKIDDIVL